MKAGHVAQDMQKPLDIILWLNIFRERVSYLCYCLATCGDMFQQIKKVVFSQWSSKSRKLELIKGSVNFCSVKMKGNEARLTTQGKVTIWESREYLGFFQQWLTQCWEDGWQRGKQALHSVCLTERKQMVFRRNSAISEQRKQCHVVKLNWEVNSCLPAILQFLTIIPFVTLIFPINLYTLLFI